MYGLSGNKRSNISEEICPTPPIPEIGEVMIGLYLLLLRL